MKVRLGVSATHLDWTMTPYVRKSFYKHYITGMKYIGCSPIDESHNIENFKKYIQNNPSIDDDYFKQIENVYKYAYDMTEKEVYQAVEGMFHNLNN